VALTIKKITTPAQETKERTRKKGREFSAVRISWLSLVFPWLLCLVVNIWNLPPNEDYTHRAVSCQLPLVEEFTSGGRQSVHVSDSTVI